ncbi:MAG TPA: allophanate hydrolase [Polyangiaceae bacterium]|jgi:allophanate hydrolase|nr:allophanate hydrolase [Polyangiaceae bacterium]
MSLESLSLAFESLRAAYRAGSWTPHAVADEVLARIDRDRERIHHVWLHVVGASDLHAAVDRATARRDAGQPCPLFGIPFAVKDNIDVAGVPTTVACPDLAYVPSTSALVVQRLVEAGALFVGKVNLDQLATGLVGTRSPYGTPTNPFDARMIPGGSSSGSGVAVAVGHVSFALGTDTAGSGRVPAGFNNVVGLKPTRGALSTRGVVPACRSFDCVSVFALTVDDASAVAAVAKQWDELDPFSRSDAQAIDFEGRDARAPWRIGVPPREQLVFLDDQQARAMFQEATERVRAMGSTLVEVDLRPFLAAGLMLYGGGFVAERLVSGGDLLERKPEGLVPVVRDILSDAKRISTQEVFESSYKLHGLRQSVEATWRAVDALLLPTTPTIYRVDEVLANPRALNSNLGVYTTFGNLMDLAAIAVPSGMRADGLPSGVQLIGPRGSDGTLAAVARSYHQQVGGSMGATGHPLPSRVSQDHAPARGTAPAPSRHAVVVVGAHLRGQPLNRQLVELGATFVRACATAPKYRLYALPGTVPPKPGLVRVREGGCAIEVEVWSLDTKSFGAFVGAIPRPLCIGSIELDDGVLAQGFLCENDVIADATDISHHGGWRAFLDAKARVP